MSVCYHYGEIEICMSSLWGDMYVIIVGNCVCNDYGEICMLLS